MSNHAGSYMLNEVITILDRHQAFAGMDETALRAVMREIVEMAKNEYEGSSRDPCKIVPLRWKRLPCIGFQIVILHGFDIC